MWLAVWLWAKKRGGDGGGVEGTPFSEWRERSGGEGISKMPGNSGAGGRPGRRGRLGILPASPGEQVGAREVGGGACALGKEGGREAGSSGPGGVAQGGGTRGAPGSERRWPGAYPEAGADLVRSLLCLESEHIHRREPKRSRTAYTSSKS